MTRKSNIREERKEGGREGGRKGGREGGRESTYDELLHYRTFEKMVRQRSVSGSGSDKPIAAAVVAVPVGEAKIHAENR